MEFLKNIFTDPLSPGGFSGIDNLLRAAKKADPSISKDQVIKYLETVPAYSLHKPSRIRYRRLKTVPSGYYWDMQIDLADFQKLAKFNSGYRYLLVGIELMSRMIFVAPVKSKSTADMQRALDLVLAQMKEYPARILSDKGLEFESKQMKEYFRRKNIQKLVSQSDDLKASVVERSIRTIKMRLYKYFTHNKTSNWMDVITKIVKALNHTKHRTLGVRPVDVTSDNWQGLWERLYGDSLKKLTPSDRYKIGNHVRIDVARKKFDKGYLPNFTHEVFKIKNIRKTNPVTYEIEDLDSQPIIGKFYSVNFAKTHPELQRVMKVHKTRKRQGDVEYLVTLSESDERIWIKEDQLV